MAIASLSLAVTNRKCRMSEQERRVYLIDAAERVFLKKGYHAATMADIACQAGMSKKTLYQVFAAKTALFDALLNDRFSVFSVTIEEDVRPPRVVLTDVLRRSVAHALTERQVAIVRLMIAESPRSPEIAAALDRLGTGRGKGGLAQWLAAKTAEGALKVVDPKETSSLLFWTAAGDFLMESLLHNTHTTTAEAIEARVERVVAGFFREMDSARAATG
jgi:AcrR family transcriptional regulator